MDDNAVAAQITQAVKTGQRVTLHYEEKIIKFPWNGETKYYITGVEVVGTSMNPYGTNPAFPGGQGQQNSSQQQPQTQPSAPTQQSATADSTL